MTNVIMFAEGVCVSSTFSANAGEYQVSLVCGSHVKTFSAKQVNTSRLQMELTAVITGFSKLKEACNVTACVESWYVKNAVNDKDGWLKGCIARGWKTARGEDLQHKELWVALVDAMKGHTVTWVWTLYELRGIPTIPTLRKPIGGVMKPVKTQAALTLDQALGMLNAMTEDDKKQVLKVMRKKPVKAVASDVVRGGAAAEEHTA